MDAISPREHAIAIVQTTEIRLLKLDCNLLFIFCSVNTYRLKKRHGAPPVVKAVAMTDDSASQVAIKQRQRLPSDHIE